MRKFIVRKKEPTIIPVSLAIGRLQELHLRSEVNLVPRSSSRYGSIISYFSHLNREKERAFSMIMKRKEFGLRRLKRNEPNLTIIDNLLQIRSAICCKKIVITSFGCHAIVSSTYLLLLVRVMSVDSLMNISQTLQALRKLSPP